MYSFVHSCIILPLLLSSVFHLLFSPAFFGYLLFCLSPLSNFSFFLSTTLPCSFFLSPSSLPVPLSFPFPSLSIFSVSLSLSLLHPSSLSLPPSLPLSLSFSPSLCRSADPVPPWAERAAGGGGDGYPALLGGAGAAAGPARRAGLR